MSKNNKETNNIKYGICLYIKKIRIELRESSQTHYTFLKGKNRKKKKNKNKKLSKSSRVCVCTSVYIIILYYVMLVLCACVRHRDRIGPSRR